VIVRKVLADHAAATLGEFRPLMLGMLTACSHDTALYRAAAALLYEAARTAVRSRKSAAAAGIRVRAITTSTTANSNSASSSRPLCAETMAAIAATHGVVKVCADGCAAVEHIGESLSASTTATAVHLWRLRAARQQQRLTRASTATAANSHHDSSSSSSAVDGQGHSVVHKGRSSPPRATTVHTIGTAAAAVISDSASATSTSSITVSGVSSGGSGSGSAVQQQQQQYQLCAQ
jgi:hypothetical protein